VGTWLNINAGILVKLKIVLFLAMAVVGAVAILVSVRIRRNHASPVGYGDYRLYATKEPFSIFVDKVFPNNRSFLVVTQKNPIVFSFDESKADDETKADKYWANISIPHVLSVNIRTDAGQRPLQLWILRTTVEGEEELLQDLNVDDTWDAKLLLKANKHFIHINNSWRAVKTISGTDHDPITATSDENTYYFDKSSGAWKIKQ
jgi:hypothetical protein